MDDTWADTYARSGDVELRWRADSSEVLTVIKCMTRGGFLLATKEVRFNLIAAAGMRSDSARRFGWQGRDGTAELRG